VRATSRAAFFCPGANWISVFPAVPLLALVAVTSNPRSDSPSPTWSATPEEPAALTTTI